MKITIYELLGLIKDGKAPKKIIVDGVYFIWFEGSYRTDDFVKEYISTYFRLENMLNDEIEIIEEVEDKEYENIEEINNAYYHEEQDKINEMFKLAINDLIRNQKEIIRQLGGKQ